MGRKRKSRAPAIDRFSELPDKVAHHILCFLTFKDLTRLGAVSRRCRQFYLSLPFVTFDSSCLPRRTTNQKRVRLLSSLDRYLLSRGDHKIDRFCIDWSFFSCETVKKLSDDRFRAMTWIHNAVRCNVEELDLHLSYGLNNRFVLPSVVFRSQSLRSLSVHLQWEIFEAPSVSFSSNLQCLKLERVTIVDERFFEWITCSCKCIKELQLIQVGGIRNMTVRSSSLESFLISPDPPDDLFHLNISGDKLEKIDINWSDCYATTSSKSLKIFAPILKVLKWKGNMRNSQNLGKLMSLEKVEILLEPRLNEFDKVFAVVRSVCWAKVLTINEETIKALFKEGSIAAPLDKICNLTILCESLNDDLVPALISLLRGMPNLNILCIKTNQYEADSESEISIEGSGMGYWKLENLAFIHHLKEVTIQVSGGSNEIEFARYILEHARNLKKMVLHLSYMDDQLKAVAEVVNRSKMISSATIVVAGSSFL